MRFVAELLERLSLVSEKTILLIMVIMLLADCLVVLILRKKIDKKRLN